MLWFKLYSLIKGYWALWVIHSTIILIVRIIAIATIILVTVIKTATFMFTYLLVSLVEVGRGLHGSDRTS